MRSALAIAASVLLFTFSFPVAGYTPNLSPSWISASAVWFFWVPLLLVLRGAEPRKSFRYGYLFGFFSNLCTLFWITIAIKKYGYLSWPLSLSIVLLLFLMLALFSATAFWLLAKIGNRAPVWFAGTVIFSLVDFSKEYLPFGGFPWTLPAYGLYSAQHLIQVCDLIGTAGLNTVIVFFNFVVAETLWRQHRRMPFPFRLVASGLLLFVGLWGYGISRGAQIEREIAKSHRVRVALIQGNIHQDLKWNEAARVDILGTYRRLSLEAARDGAELIVWPEAAVPMTIPSDSTFFPYLIDISGKADFVLGAATWTGTPEAPIYRNSALITSGAGKIKLRYDKQHLVPFGEYVPFSTVLPMHYFVPAIAGNFDAGKNPSLGVLRSEEYGLLICYEVLFPELSIDQVRDGARFLVNITNDAWFDETSGPYQHFHFGLFRAIETRRSYVRAANTGVSGFVDPLGRIVNRTRLFQEAVITSDVPSLSLTTLFVRAPFLTPILLAMAAVGLGIMILRRRASSE